MFERPVELDDKVILRRLAENDAQALVVGAFHEAIRALRSPSASRRSRRTRSAYPRRRRSRGHAQTVDGEHTVFNLTPVDSSLEARFAQLLDRASDVTAWAKLTMNSRFALEYISKAGALRYYYPDFVLRLTDDTCLIIETKGQEDLDVALKDRRARRWCRDATALAGRDWAYEKVPRRCSTPTLGGPSRASAASSPRKAGSRRKSHEPTSNAQMDLLAWAQDSRASGASSSRSTPSALRAGGSS